MYILILLQWLVNVFYIIAGILFLPIAIYRLIFQNRYKRGLLQRLGFIKTRFGPRPSIWIHAVSVGEVNASKPLIKRLKQQLPFHEIFISTITDTGYDQAVKIVGEDNVFFLPVDFSFVIRRAIKRLKPSLIILMELELWPNLLIEADKENIPVIIANGRITEKSLRLYKLIKPLTEILLSKLACALVQDKTYEDRFLQLGMPSDKIYITGSLKWDSAELKNKVDSADKLAEEVLIDKSKHLIVAGSTGGDVEEEAIIRAYYQLRSRFTNLQLAIIPRKPERFDRVAQIISSRGFYPVRRSESLKGKLDPLAIKSKGKPPIILGDTMGELKKFYNLATIVIIGRTFIPMGGSDVMEAAALGKPIIVGPYYDNFREPVEILAKNGAAIIIDGPEKLASTIEELLLSEDTLHRISESARKTVRENQGASRKTAEKICNLLGFEYDTTERSIAVPKLQSA